MPDLHGQLTPQGNLNGTLNTIVYASNYNVLENKPSINSVTLQGNKTASELGLATPEDITVTSVNGETGAVVLDGSDINYDSVTTINNKIDDLQSQISSSGVLAVNGKTGVVILTGADINYSAGVTLNSKIDAVESEIPTVSYPVTSVNSKTGAVVLDGSDIAYDTNNTVNEKIAAVESEIPTVDYPVTSVNEQTGDVSLTDNDISHYTGTPTAGSTAYEIGYVKGITPTYSGSTDQNTVVKQIGKLVIVSLDLYPTNAGSTTGSEIISGLPKAKATTWASGCQRSAKDLCSFQVIAGSDKLYIYHNTASVRYIGQVVYFTDDM